MSRKSTPSQSKSVTHTETQSQKLAKVKATEGGVAAAKPTGDMSNSVRINERAVKDVAALSAAQQATLAKAEAAKAVATAKQLTQVAKDMFKKAASAAPPKNPSSATSKRKVNETPETSRKRISTAPGQMATRPKRTGPFVDASLEKSQVRPSVAKPLGVDASLNKGYPRCILSLFIPHLCIIPFGYWWFLVKGHANGGPLFTRVLLSHTYRFASVCVFPPAPPVPPFPLPPCLFSSIPVSVKCPVPISAFPCLVSVLPFLPTPLPSLRTSSIAQHIYTSPREHPLLTCTLLESSADDLTHSPPRE